MEPIFNVLAEAVENRNGITNSAATSSEKRFLLIFFSLKESLLEKTSRNIGILHNYFTLFEVKFRF